MRWNLPQGDMGRRPRRRRKKGRAGLGGKEQDDEFAFQGMGLVMETQGGGGAQLSFFKFFGQFAGDEEAAVGPQLLLDFVEEFQDAVGGFIEGDGTGKIGKFAETAAAGRGFVVEESFEQKAASFGETAQGDGRGQGGGTGDDGNGEAGGAYGFGGAGAGIGDAGHAGVGHQGQGFACANAREDFIGAGAFVVFVAGEKGGVNGIGIEEGAGVPGVFGKNAGGAAQDAEGAQGDVFSVADGRADEVEAGGQGRVLRRGRRRNGIRTMLKRRRRRIRHRR